MKASVGLALTMVSLIAISECAFSDPPADAARGSRLFMQCQACHTLTARVASNVGPSLAGVVGRRAATVEGYPYSAALSAANLVWDQATLDRWLMHPSTLVPGTKMIFTGIANPDDRSAIIAYLRQAPGAAK